MTSVIAESKCPFTRLVHTWAWMEAVLISFVLVGCVAPGSMRFIVWISTIILFQTRIRIAVNMGVHVPLQRDAKKKLGNDESKIKNFIVKDSTFIFFFFLSIQTTETSNQ